MNPNPVKKQIVASSLRSGMARIGLLGLCALFAFGHLAVSAPADPLAPAPVLTKVREVRQLAEGEQSIACQVRLEGVVLWTSTAQDQLILQDDSGGVRIEMDLRDQPVVQIGQRVLLEGWGIIGAGRLREALVSNDGVHPAIEKSDTLYLAAGRHPIRFDWFNVAGFSELAVAFQGPELPRQKIPDSALFPVKANPASGLSNEVHGLNYSSYQGDWLRIPDFQNLPVQQRGIASNFDMGMRTRVENEGLQFTGFLEVPRAGLYTFWITSDDGSRLFVDAFSLRLTVLGEPSLPKPLRIFPGQTLDVSQDCQWVTLEGIITFVDARAGGLDLELHSGMGLMRLEVTDLSGEVPRLLLNSRIRATGSCLSAFTPDGQRSVGTLLVPTLKQIELLEPAPAQWTACPVSPISRLERANFLEAKDTVVHVRGKIRSLQPGESLVVEDETGVVQVETTQPLSGSVGSQIEVLGQWTRTGTNLVLRCGFYRELANPSQGALAILPLLTTIEQVKSLNREEAKRGYPVKIRGIITAPFHEGFFIQDATWSVYVRWQGLNLPDKPRAGDFWEVEGNTYVEFAPNIRARQAVRLGSGIMPEPLRPTWEQLSNGTLDTRYVEIQGVVTSAGPDGMEVLSRVGKIKVQLSDVEPAVWKRYENAHIRVRGCAIPRRDDDTQQVQSGQLYLCNFSVSVDEPAPLNPFLAPLKHVSDLLRFDSRASVLNPVKIVGQILHEQGGEFFLREGANGLRFIPRIPVHLQVGDTVEVVGFPDLGEPSPVLREAFVRRSGHAPLPLPQPLLEESLVSRRHDATLVCIRARLTDISTDRSDQILTLQAGSHGFVARLNTSQGLRHDLLPGSKLELSGVYAGQGGDPASGRGISSFELLLNSPADIRVLERPGWWTLRRLLAGLGSIAVVLVGAMLWALTLKRQVNAQTKLIHQKVEGEATLEERARIAREIHDTLEQSLVAASFQLNALAGSLHNPKESWRLLEMARSMLRHAQEESRRTVRNLRLLALEKHDLPAALAELATQSGDGLPTDILVSVTGVPRALPSQVENHLLRIGQEATTNAIKHAKAKTIRVEIEYGADWVQLTVSDDGCGFDAAHAAPTEAGHFGLLGLRERTDKIGGNLKIISAPGQGATLQVKVPLPQSSPSTHSNSIWK